jgi:hypothetical protein
MDPKGTPAGSSGLVSIEMKCPWALNGVEYERIRGLFFFYNARQRFHESALHEETAADEAVSVDSLRRCEHPGRTTDLVSLPERGSP